jgi:hypothetical protein
VRAEVVNSRSAMLRRRLCSRVRWCELLCWFQLQRFLLAAGIRGVWLRGVHEPRLTVAVRWLRQSGDKWRATAAPLAVQYASVAPISVRRAKANAPIYRMQLVPTYRVMIAKPLKPLRTEHRCERLPA